MAQVFGEESKYLIRNDLRNYIIAACFLFVIFFSIYFYSIIGLKGGFLFPILFITSVLILKKIGEKHLSISDKFFNGRSGEYEICDELKKIPDSYFIFRNIRINDKRGDIDLIVLGPTGIFTIKVKSHKGRIDFSGEGLTINGKGLEKNFLGQAMGEALNLKDYLGENGISNIFVEPVLVFSSKYASMRFGLKKIKNVYVIQKAYLKDLILKNNGNLSPENIEKIKNVLIPLTENK